jgi:hypothetical protein
VKKSNHLTYATGEPVLPGDVVHLGTWEGMVEELVREGGEGWAEYWRDATGEGVLLVGPAFGRLFTQVDDPDLHLVRRGPHGLHPRSAP